MGMNVICPHCGHSERSSNRRGARIGPCPKCGTQMRAHTAGKAEGRYICPIAGGVATHGLGHTVQLTEPVRLVFVPGWDDDRYEPDPDRPGWNRRVTYHRDTPRSSEQDYLDRAAGRVFGPGCVVRAGFQQPAPSDQWHGRAGAYLVPTPEADPATWFVNEPVTYKKCAACPKRVVASDKTRIDHEWVPARESFMYPGEVDPGPHPAGTYACRDCRPKDARPATSPGQEAATASAAPPEAEQAAVRPAATAGQPQPGGAPTVSGSDEGHADAHAALRDAVSRLAGVCDFAESLDGQGFNATDTWLGHVLAAMPAEAWTEDEALAGWDMLRKYRGQLDGFGVCYDNLPRPPGAGELEAARREEARERARQRGRQWREQQYRTAHSYVRCDGAGEKITLGFPFDPALVDEAKAIKGRSFDWDTKTNTYPFASLPQVVGFADAHGVDVAAEVRALVPAAVTQAEQEAARPHVYTDPAGRVVIAAEFSPRLNEALKALNGGRSTWDRAARVHRPPIHRDPGRVLEIAEQFGLTVGEDARTAIEAETAKQENNQAAATAFEADPVPVPGLAEGLSLKPQQYPVVWFAREHRRVLIGDDMGWGKTLSSLAAVAVDSGYPVVVVCRPSLTLNWIAEIRRFFPGLTVYEASGTTAQPIPDGTDVIVIGSAALAAKPHATKTGKQFGWVKALVAVGPKALIIDEGQDTKERSANRSQACEQLAAAVIAIDGLVLDLTGTAILNRPRELCQQLTILGRISEFGGPKAFLWRYCLSETNEWGASYNGARNLTELHGRLLRWGVMIRRSDDAKLGLPPCREHVLRIPQADLDPAVMARYRQAERDLLGYLAEQARQAAERLGADPTHAAVQAAMRAQAAEHLVAINTLRQLAGHAKRGYVTTWIRGRVAVGEKVMVAAHHRDEVDHYASQFGGLKLQGGQAVAAKEAAKAAFQQQPAAQAPVIAVAIGAGGVGHTLTAAAVGIQAEQAWTPGETQQMKKRLHRIGQDRPVDYYITVAENTIDEHLWEVVATKQATLDAVLDGKSDDGAADDESSVIAEVAWRLTRQGLNCSPPSQPSRQQDGPQDGEARRDTQSADHGGHDSQSAGSHLADGAVGQALRQAAHFYLGHGLLPVPGWAAKANGACGCPRGVACPRPGKHPRSVHVGPGEHDYSWKPLACRTHEEVEQRFAHGGCYADANLMLAIPPGMLVVDQDDDDGGPQAMATLAAQLGELPGTLAHRTPHGVHRIYRTPPGWTGRAWVGKDARNPLPAGIDLRAPGQILMAPPSRVPAPEGMASYGPPSGTQIVDLPAAYVTAWTPPQIPVRGLRRPVPVPPSEADRAARYVHTKITGILAGLESETTARNTALYTAALKIGSTLGAARATPGAEHAAAAWTGQTAEDALIQAAETNGYLAKDGPAEARSAIRSGLRNGLRNPRPLPAFTTQPTTPPPANGSARRHQHARETPDARQAQATPPQRAGEASPQTTAARPEDPQAAVSVIAASRAAPAASNPPRRGLGNRARSAGQKHAAAAAQKQDAWTGPSPAAQPAPQPLNGETPTVDSVAAVLQAAGFVASSEALQAAHVPEGYQVQAAPGGAIILSHVAIDEAVNGASPSARTEQMLARYACALHAAGFRVSGPTRHSITIHPEADRQAAPAREPDSPADIKAGSAHSAVYQASGPAATRRDRQPRQPTRGPAAEPQAGRARAEPQHFGPEDPPGLPPAGGDPGQPQVQHPPEPVGEGTKDGQTITPRHVPAHGEDLPQTAGDLQRRHLATEADRQAGQPFHSGDIDRAHHLLTGAHAPEPERHQRVDQAETQIRHSIAEQEPQQVSHSTETAPCPQCGLSSVRPAGEATPCLSCQTQARLKAAGFTADSPEIKQAAGWNHAIARSGDHQPETSQQPELTPPDPHPQSAALPYQMNTPEPEKEASG